MNPTSPEVVSTETFVEQGVAAGDECIDRRFAFDDGEGQGLAFAGLRGDGVRVAVLPVPAAAVLVGGELVQVHAFGAVRLGNLNLVPRRGVGGGLVTRGGLAAGNHDLGELSGTAGLGQGVNVSNVTFEAGCRNNWHIHHKACQILIAVGGRGYYQEWGKEPVELNPGDVVYVAPETKHWHGAAPDSDFAHIAIMNAVDGASNEWLEPVEAEYDALR